ncbi:hypothetical protein GCM10010411_40710 [Actinomadura fulvescens]|uniref:histidine kinase n=1 Tax=Actinomadura fulvescens TaxID=46160 RepID=A0ABP6C8J6_9ACTN
MARWMERVFDSGSAPVRFIVLAAIALGDLRLLHRPEDATGWALALTGLAVCLAGCVAPVAATVVLPVLVLAGDRMDADVSITLKAMIAVALFELALRSSARGVLVGSAVTVGLLLVHALDGATWAQTLYRLAILAGFPLLLGAYVRLVREKALRERERVRAAERAAIARELHDLVAHHISSMVLRAGVARHVLPGGDPRVAEVLGDLHDSGTAALADLRDLVAVLRDPALVDPGVSLVERSALPEALRGVVERGVQAGLRLTDEIDPAVAELDAVRRLTILRLAQEGLANVAKHAGPGTGARFSVHVTDASVRLEIVDDGRTRPEAAPGHGLIGMTERVELLGGHLIAGPRTDGQGWHLHAELPVTEPSTHAAPEAFTHAGLEASAHAAPEASTHAGLEASAHAAPEPFTHAGLEASAHADPEASTHAGLEASAHAAPEPLGEGAA